jgi:ribonuclease R
MPKRRRGQPAPHQGGRRLVGRLWRHAEGFGFVTPVEATGPTRDIFIGRDRMANALHGDLVEVALGGRAHAERGRRSPRRGPSGQILRIVERASARIIGRYEPRPHGGVLIPLDERVAPPLPVAPPPRGQPPVEAGSLVAGELAPTGALAVHLVRNFGRGDTPQWDTDLVIEQFGLPVRFSAEADAEAARYPSAVTPQMRERRRDLRALPTVTIDGERARDFDDAISVERTRRGWRLWVHVADVGHYVPWGSALDAAARTRGTSVYFPDRAVPMLPERLSNDLCSLNPAVERLAMTVEQEFDHQGRRLGHELYQSVIRSDARLTYTGVAAALESSRAVEAEEPYRSLRPMLQLAAELAERLRHQRMVRGSLDFDLPEPEILLDLEGQPTDILREPRTVAHRLIEECMLVANEMVAQHLTHLKVPLLYRIHEPPDPEKLAAFALFARSVGYQLPKRAGSSSAPLQALLESVRDHPEERLLNHLLLRSMKRAHYGPEPIGHFGLASDCYTHFTSPIRRYPDLVVHRILKETLDRGALSASRREQLAALLTPIGQQSSERERVAMEAEWEVVKVKKARFMTERIGECYRGHITGVTRHGLFVELEEIFVEGFVPLRTLPRDHYRFDDARHTLAGSRHHRYRLADPVAVVVEGVDLDRRRVNFVLDVGAT